MSKYALKKGLTYETEQEGDTPSLTFDMVKNANNFLAEHFGCFYLYAFDHCGRPYKITHAASELEKMALERLSETDLAMANAGFDVIDEEMGGGDWPGEDGNDDDDDDDDCHGGKSSG